MPYLLIRHSVEDYARWKPVYDEGSTIRKDSGSRGAQLFRNADTPNELVVVFEWEDLEQARQFANSAVLREKMQRAGVIGRPEMYFLEEVERTPA